jgi:hypothetical protein
MSKKATQKKLVECEVKTLPKRVDGVFFTAKGSKDFQRESEFYMLPVKLEL